ncbi:MAG: acetyl-CoA hydrolase/transferase C-terminal domain-containing protein [Porphyromonas sp.]|nr:acetyl-CoA hydrolase/transferase C-terminal domain-containing protein [Porphyromonas sp.]
MKKEKIMTLEAAVSEIKDGEKIVLGHGAVTPNCVVEELVRQKERYTHLSIFHLIYLGNPIHLERGMEKHFRVYSPFINGKAMRDAINEGRAEFIPRHFSKVPSLFFERGSFQPDWGIVQVTPPDAEGRYSCSLASDYTLPAARAAKKVLAVVNPQLPYIGGDNFLTEDEIDIIVEHSSAPHTLPAAVPNETEKQVAKYCAELIPDRATLQIGIGALPDAVLALLKGHKDLGIHTELLTPGVLELYKSGAITGKYKGDHPNKMTASFTMGDQSLYDFLDHNAEFEQYTVDYMNDPVIIGKNPNMISINSCIEVDLYGQVCAEKVGGKVFSGSGGQFDYVRGVGISEGGKSIIAIQSTAKDGQISRITPLLGHRNVVTSMRNDVEYIVTEYGIAHLSGKTEAERAMALINVAHPKFRDELTKSAMEQFPSLKYHL